MNYRLFTLLVLFALSVALLPTNVSAQLLESLSGLAVVDSTGQELGPVIGVERDLTRVVVAFEVNGIVFPIQVGQNDFKGSSNNNPRFLSTDCSGTPYMGPEDELALPRFRVAGPGMTVYVADYSQIPQTLATQSTIDEQGVCTQNTGTNDYVPATALVDLFDYFTPPFSLQAEAGQDITALQQQVDDLSDDFTNHTHTYQTGKGGGHNRVTVNTGPAMPAAP